MRFFAPPETSYPILRDFILPIGFVAQSLISIQEGEPEKAVFCIAAAALLPVIIKQVDKITNSLVSDILTTDSSRNLLISQCSILYLANAFLALNAASHTMSLIH